MPTIPDVSEVEQPIDPPAMTAMVEAFTTVIDNFPTGDVDEDLTEAMLVLVGVLGVKLRAFATANGQPVARWTDGPR